MADAKALYDKRVSDVKAAYGTVPVEDYETMKAEMPQQFEPEKLEHTLREDWEVGFGEGYYLGPDEGILSYSAQCKQCGASASINQRVTLTR